MAKVGTEAGTLVSVRWKRFGKEGSELSRTIPLIIGDRASFRDDEKPESVKTIQIPLAHST